MCRVSGTCVCRSRLRLSYSATCFLILAFSRRGEAFTSRGVSKFETRETCAPPARPRRAGVGPDARAAPESGETARGRPARRGEPWGAVDILTTVEMRFGVCVVCGASTGPRAPRSRYGEASDDADVIPVSRCDVGDAEAEPA